MTTTTMGTLADGLRGHLIAPGDDEYDAARTLFYGGMDRHPAAIARVADAGDVARAVTAARDAGMPLSVRSGGHSVSGQSVIDDAIVIDLAEMQALDIDPRARTARAEAGLTAEGYTRAAAEHGLATGFGDAGSVGLGGITVGGGVGFLSRPYGLTIDSLRSAEIVTADGEVRTVDAERDPELFWAIRGGGGNFGVVTRLELGLHDVGSVVGGLLVTPATAETIEAFVAEALVAPDELTTIANVMPCPPMPFLPEEAHGSLVILTFVTCVGDAEAAERAIAPLRAIGPPIADMVRPIAYPEMYMPGEEGYHPIGVSRTMFVDDFGAARADAIMEHLAASTATMRVAQLRVLGGAIARVPNDATAYAHRDRAIMVNTAALVDDPADVPEHDAWVGGFAEALRRDARPGAYVNFLGDDGAERIREAYPGGTWDRLTRIKARVDPDNVFRHNQNIPPAAG